MGWTPIPLRQNDKIPIGKNWQKSRGNQVPVGHRGNVGIALGDNSSGLIVLDLDCDEAIELADKHMPKTAIGGKESSRGCHRFYYCPGIKTHRFNGQDGQRLVEILSTGTQVVVYPSIHPSGAKYTEITGTPLVLSELELLLKTRRLVADIWKARYGIEMQTKRKQPQPASQPQNISHADRKTRASAYLAKMPPAVSGCGGHNALFRAAVAMAWGFDLSEGETLQLLAHDYNPRCTPPWKEKDLKHKIRSALSTPHEYKRGWLAEK